MEQEKKLDVYFGNDDKLHWDIYAKNLRQIILGCDSYPRSNDNLSYVIGIDSPWGTGKTYFTSMFSNYLQGYYYRPGSTTQAVEMPKTCSVVYYDAWENDFWDNAFEPLFDKMFNSDTFKDLAEKTDVRDMAKSIGRMCRIGATGFLYKLAENVIDKNSIEKIGKEAENTWKKGMTDGTKIEALFPEYTDFRDAIETLRQYLKEVVQHKGKVVIIIDELDRCRPTFAVQTLEIVKHLFNVEGLIFIFSLDIHQLSHCVCRVYGAKFEAIGYLERFFNYLTILPRSDSAMAGGAFWDEYQLNENQKTKACFFEIMHGFNLTLRDMRTILSSYYVLAQTVLSPYQEIDDAKILYFYFLTMKYKYPQEFVNAVFEHKTEAALRILRENTSRYSTYNPLKNPNESHALYKLLKNNYALSVDAPDHFTVVCSSGRTFPIKNFRDVQYHDDLGLYVKESNKDPISFNNEDSLSYFFYTPDLNMSETDNLVSMTPWEYLYRKIEMCDFLPVQH